jgi:uncharacterized membrane protein
VESKAKIIGHPLHPILIPFPLGLLSTSVIFDVVHLLTGNGKWSEISFWMIAAGVIGGLVAAVFGLIDWLAIPPRHARQSGRNVARRYQRGHGDAVHLELAAPRGCSG